MAKKIQIKFYPQGFAEVMGQAEGFLKGEAQKIANRATAQTNKGSGFHVEMTREAMFKDPAYGVDRPVARIVPNDDESAKEEWEDKILSRSVQ